VSRLCRWLTIAFAVASCTPQPKPPPPDKLVLTRTGFDALPGWREDPVLEALPALLRSCDALARLPPGEAIGPEALAGTASDWSPLCEGARAVPGADDEAARRFLAAWFVPFRASNNDEPTGLFTGYYEPEIEGCDRPMPGCAVPVYRRPADLIAVELGRFRPAWRGERIGGRVENGVLVPYASRTEIEGGALVGRDLELFWARDPIELFFLQIQGSGRVRLPDGSVRRIGFDGQNGHAYVPIGRLLAERGEIPRSEVTMQSIKAWLRARPAEGAGLMRDNPSYVFFRELEGEGPVGSQGVALVPGRSLAVDRSFIPLGPPIWLDAGPGLRRLVVAQDTGGAIRGPVRGDLFWGPGPEAEEKAGMMKAKGTYYLLLPAAVAARQFPAS
jgi:membrane-bound lytic murein transglycosylase A